MYDSLIDINNDNWLKGVITLLARLLQHILHVIENGDPKGDQ